MFILFCYITCLPVDWRVIKRPPKCHQEGPKLQNKRRESKTTPQPPQELQKASQVPLGSPKATKKLPKRHPQRLPQRAEAKLEGAAVIAAGVVDKRISLIWHVNTTGFLLYPQEGAAASPKGVQHPK